MNWFLSFYELKYIYLITRHYGSIGNELLISPC